MTASGKILRSFVVYKGTKGGTIHRRELPKHPQGNAYTIQRKVWFDKKVMLEWVNTTLAPYTAMAPISIIPILFIDSFKVHMLGSMAEAIHKLGVEIKFILPGCTGLIQPINVGFNKPYKANYTKLYMNFLMDQDANKPLSGAKRGKHVSVDSRSGWINLRGDRQECLTEEGIQLLQGVVLFVCKGYSYYNN